MTRQVEVVGNYRYVLNTKTDECIYMKSRVRPSGRDNWEGSDLYAHKGKNGNIIFYRYSWTRWQDGHSYITVLSKNEAEDFLIEATKYDEWGYPHNEEDEEQLKRYDLNIMEEGEILNNRNDSTN
jgi:hypothetical protein